MCGFLVLHRSRASIDTAELELCASVLQHRGPDGRNIWHPAPGHTAFVFNRLALVGPREEMQPFVDVERGIHVVVNGEIYGYRGARAALEQRGARFRTRSDCELILHAYAQSGMDFVSQLNGEFAFVIWDARKGTFIAGRDRWGIKPLFYRTLADEIVFASEVKAIAALGTPTRWDGLAVYQHLLAATLPGQTLFAGVRQVEPAHYLEVRDNSIRSVRYWRGAVEVREQPAQASEEALRNALRMAVEDRLDADYPVATCLSGGLDSAGITALAAASVERTLEAFTVDFGDDRSEAAAAAEIAGVLRVKHHVIEVSEADLVQHFEDAVWHAESIGFNAVGVARWLLSRSIREHGYKAALVGDGADELFGGYAFSVMDAEAARSPAKAQAIRAVLESNHQNLARELGLPFEPQRIDGRRFRGGCVPFLLESWAHTRFLFQHVLSRDFRAEFGGENPTERLLDSLAPEALGELSPLRASLSIWQKSLFVNQILVAERLDMAHGVESRFPYLDARVAAVADAFSSEQLMVGYRGKAPLRAALSDSLPPHVVRREKQPFQAPPLSTMRHPIFMTYVREVLASETLRDQNIFDIAACEKLLDQWPHMSERTQARVDPLLMALVSTHALQRRFRIVRL